MTLKSTLAASIALLGIAATGAHAAPPTESTQPSAAVTAPEAAAPEARRVVRDPVTGQLRAPTAEELAAERAAARARGQLDRGPGAPLRVRQHANGMRSAVLGPDYMVTLQAERGADGKLVIKHANPAHEHAHAAPADQAAPASSSTAATK